MTDTVPSGPAKVPEGLVSSVVSLVNTGPVLLGAYTVAELTAVDAIVDFLEVRPSDEVLAEAVRSLAARELLVAGSSGDQMRVRGDLGIAVAFQQRARMVLDARVVGSEPGEPWRVLLLPQPEDISLVVRIDALGVHELGLYSSDDALDQLSRWLPAGDPVDPADSPDVDTALADAKRSALVTASRYTAQGSAEIAEAATDLVLVSKDGRLYAYARDLGSSSTLVARPLVDDEVRDTIAGLLG